MMASFLKRLGPWARGNTSFSQRFHALSGIELSTRAEWDFYAGVNHRSRGK